MGRARLALAFLGAVLVAVVAELLLPDTPVGRAVVFLAYGAALYPVFEALWLSEGRRWKY
jgi:hypothetical protein